MAISPKVIQLIEQKLKILIHQGCEIDRIKMVCAIGTEIAKASSIQTNEGSLRIAPSHYIPKGRAYLIEEKCRGFTWIR